MKNQWRTAVLWPAANIISFGLVGALFHNFPLAFTFSPDLAHLGSFNLLPAIFGGVFFGFVPALMIGFSQRLILGRDLSLSRWWIISAAAGVGLMHFLSDGFENARDLSLAVLVSGLLAGVIQSRTLRPNGPASAAWIMAIGLGWFVGWVIGIACLRYTGLLYRPWAAGLDGQQHGLLGLAVGITISLSTGLLLMRLRNDRTAG